ALYFRRVLPAIGRLICGKDGPYNYLPSSVGAFPLPGEMLEMLRQAGYVDCAWQPYTFGIAGLYTATRPPIPSNVAPVSRPAVVWASTPAQSDH
ncbi:MAG: class I SAM-dependent methyltransferase, partial [Terracidiphilus sp.]|nr:class I SAM-dependent methyltransferase [Terracidiphilus sp.]